MGIFSLILGDLLGPKFEDGSLQGTQNAPKGGILGVKMAIFGQKMGQNDHFWPCPRGLFLTPEGQKFGAVASSF